MQRTLTYPTRPRRGLAAILALTILLHMILLGMLRAPSAPLRLPDQPRWAEPLTVRILPPPPKPQPITRAEPPARLPKPDKPAAPPRVPAARPEPERAAPDTPSQPTMTMVPAQPAEPAPAGNVPAFDPDAARAAARGMANDLNPSTNWAAEKLNKGKEWKQTKEQRLGRNVENAARGDCRTEYAGAGLLAPLAMLMDKKDSGCKW